MAKTQILHVAVDKPTERTLRSIAKENQVSLSDVLRKAISLYLKGSPDIQELAAQPKEAVSA